MTDRREIRRKNRRRNRQITGVRVLAAGLLIVPVTAAVLLSSASDGPVVAEAAGLVGPSVSATTAPLVVSPVPGPPSSAPAREVYATQIAGYPGGATLWGTVRPGEVGTAVLSISADPWVLLAPGGGFGINGTQFWATDRMQITDSQWAALFNERPTDPMVIIVADFGGIRNYVHAVQGGL